MKPVYLFGLLVVALLATLPVSEAMVSAPSKPLSGIATKSMPFKYVDNKINPGEVYEFYLLNITVRGNRPFANLDVKVYDKNGVLQMWFLWMASARWGMVFNGGQGPTFTVQRIEPARCITRTNHCTEDVVRLSVT